MPQQPLLSLALLNDVAPARIKGDRKSRIRPLPFEIWRRVSFFLSVSDRAAVAFCSGKINKKLDQSNLEALKEDPEEKLKYLQSTIEYLPKHFLCCICSKRHRRASGCPVPFDERPAESQAYLVPHFKHITFEHVQLHIHRQKFGRKHGASAPEFRELSFYWKDSESIYRYKAHANVVQGHLLLKIQCKTKITRVAAVQSLWDEMDFLPQCGHYGDELKRLCHCALEHTRNRRMSPHVNQSIPGCGTCSPMRRCHTCPSEYKVHVTKYAQIFRLHVTRWVDLGDGKLPLCREWRACAQSETSFTVENGTAAVAFDLQGLPSVRRRHESKRKWKIRRRRAPKEEPKPLGGLSAEEEIAKRHAHMRTTNTFGRGRWFSSRPPDEGREGEFTTGGLWPGMRSPMSGAIG